ncbi:hypothetical protein T492DRAFT_965359 [Pavlovales sp. CCMP2436]|nr:hypothetical protein T492DRAFT_965359 [Pavlovales sp. CCMP2436]
MRVSRVLLCTGGSAAVLIAAVLLCSAVSAGAHTQAPPRARVCAPACLPANSGAHWPTRMRLTLPRTAITLRGGGLAAAVALADHSGKAATLFGNMRVPASLLAGALLPLAFGFPMPPCKDEVSHLLMRDYEQYWLGTNVHFLLGLLGAVAMIGIRAGLLGGVLPAATAVSGILLMTSIVNRGIAIGDGSGVDGVKFGSHFGSLIMRYMFIVAQQAVREGGPLALASVILPTASVALALRRLFAPPSISSK